MNDSDKCIANDNGLPCILPNDHDGPHENAPNNASIKLRDELVALLKKHGATLVEHDDYDNDENWCGSHFSINGIAEGSDLYVTLNEIADALIKANVK